MAYRGAAEPGRQNDREVLSKKQSTAMESEDLSASNDPLIAMENFR